LFERKKFQKKKQTNVPLDRLLTRALDELLSAPRMGGSPKVSFYHARAFAQGAVRRRNDSDPHRLI